jgi:hypothetical protein
LGQSKRQFGTRLKEHQKAISTLDKGKSALAERRQSLWLKTLPRSVAYKYEYKSCFE